MKILSAIVGVVILTYLSIKHHHRDLFDHHDEIPGFYKSKDKLEKENETFK